VPASSFYPAGEGPRMVRFAFCKRTETLEQAAERLAGLRAAV
jgi:aspartate/methionine/tyrosine aminotransferase